MGQRFLDADASPWLWIGNIWAVLASTVFIIMRLSLRRRQYGLDDLLNLLSYAFGIMSSGILFKALEEGLGSSDAPVYDNKSSHLTKLVIASSCLCFVADGCSKASTIALIKRVVCNGVGMNKRRLVICWGVLSMCLAWMVLVVALLASSCSSTMEKKSCGKHATSITVMIVLGIISELTIFALALGFFGRLQMKLSLKISTITIFALRLPTIIFYIGFVKALRNYAAEKSHSTIIYGSALYWQLALVAYVVVIAAILSLKSIVDSMNTSGAAVADTLKSSGQSYQLQFLTSLKSTDQPDGPTRNRTDTMVLGPDFGGESRFTTHTNHVARQNRDSINSDDSNKMIINRVDTWSV